MERMWWSFCLVLVYAQRNTSKGSNIVLIQVILALKYFSAFVFSEGHISAIVSQFRLSSLALMLCSDIYCLLLYYKMISIQDEPKYLQSFYCFTSMNTQRLFCPAQWKDFSASQALQGPSYHCKMTLRYFWVEVSQIKLFLNLIMYLVNMFQHFSMVINRLSRQSLQKLK